MKRAKTETRRKNNTGVREVRDHEVLASREEARCVQVSQVEVKKSIASPRVTLVAIVGNVVK